MTLKNTYLTKREFYGTEFYAFLQQQFDEARHYLKNCGKPKDDIDKWFIQFNKETIKFCASLMRD